MFLRDLRKESCPFELIKIDQSFNGNQNVKVTILLDKKKEIVSKVPSLHRFIINNTQHVKNGLKLKLMKEGMNKVKERFIDANF